MLENVTVNVPLKTFDTMRKESLDLRKLEKMIAGNLVVDLIPPVDENSNDLGQVNITVDLAKIEEIILENLYHFSDRDWVEEYIDSGNYIVSFLGK